MKKIAILINSLKMGGAERTVQTIVNTLCDRYEIHLLTLEKQSYFNIDKRVKVLCLSEHQNGLGSIKKVLSLPIYAIKLWKYLNKNNISVVQSNLFRSNYVNILSKVLGSKHQVQIVDHTLSNRLFHEGLSGKINLFLIKLFYKRADVSISVSREVQKQLEMKVRLPEKKVVIPNPFDVTDIKSKSNEQVDDFQFKNENVYLVSVGRVNSVKRHDLMIKALNKLNNKKFHLLIIGEEENVTFSELIEFADHEECIHFLGPKDNPYKYMSRCDILLLTSESESFGNVLVESMICGTVVMSTDCGGPREILFPEGMEESTGKGILQGEYGLLMPVDNVESIATSIELLFNDKAVKEQYLSKHIERIKYFSLDKIVNQYSGILDGE